MAESTLALTLTDLRKIIAQRLGYTYDYSGLAAAKSAHVDRVVKDALRDFYFNALNRNGTNHAWSFLQPANTIMVWPTTESTLDSAPVVVASTVDGAHVATTTLTAADPIFTSNMIGRAITIDSVANTILEVTSSTVCVLASAISESGGEDVTIDASTVTVDDDMFYDSAVGKDLTIGSNTYEILAVTSTLVCIVAGDASAEVDEEETTLTADGSYRLPDDFGIMVGHLLTFDLQTGYPPVPLGGEGQIRARRQQHISTGRPQMVAVQAAVQEDYFGQRFNLLVWPIPDAAYTLHYVYSIIPDTLVATTREYPLGGAAHTQTIKLACLAAVEADLGIIGNDTALYQKALATSVSRDVQLKAPAYLTSQHGGVAYENRHFITGVSYDGTPIE